MAEPKPLELLELRKRFGKIEALRGVSFSVEPGEVFGYLGPNGAGKTTTLRIVLGLMRASDGSCRIFGKSPADASGREAIGFLPGDLRLYGDMTGLETLDFFARFRPAAPPVLRESLRQALDLDASVLARRVKFLSQGTRQKIGLIAAMQHDPRLLLLDEPSNGLDPLGQHALRGILSAFAARGRSVLFSSHVLSEVEKVCRRVAIVRGGEIVALETIDGLRSKVVRTLTVEFRNGVPDLSGIPGVSGIAVDGERVRLRIRGDINPVLRVLAQADVGEMVFPEPELEDVFLTYYRDSGTC